MTWPVVAREPLKLPALAGYDADLWRALMELTDVRPGIVDALPGPTR